MPEAIAPEELVAAGYQARREHRLEEALADYRKAADLYKSIGDPLKYTHTLRHVADILRERNALPEAGVYYAESLAVYRDHPEAPKLDVANTLRGFALVKEQAGDPQAAKQMWQEARDLYAAGAPTKVDAGVTESEEHIAALNELH